MTNFPVGFREQAMLGSGRGEKAGGGTRGTIRNEDLQARAAERAGYSPWPVARVADESKRADAGTTGWRKGAEKRKN